MNGREIVRLGSVRGVERFQECLNSLRLTIPCDRGLARGWESPLGQPLVRDGIKIGNRIAIHPMEGWDGTAEATPPIALFAAGSDSAAAAPS